MEIQSIRFRRKEDSNWESGLIIRTKDKSLIVDMDAYPLEGTVWDLIDRTELVVNYNAEMF